MTQTIDSVSASGQVFPWLVVALVIIVAAGGFIWLDRKIEGLQARSDPYQDANTDKTKQTLQDVQSAQQKLSEQVNDIQRKLETEAGERKLIADQLGTLSSRVEALASANAESGTPTLPQAQKNRRGKR